MSNFDGYNLWKTFVSPTLGMGKGGVLVKDKFCDICGTNLANRDLGIIAICDCCLPKFYKNFCESLDNDIDKSIALSGMFTEFQKRQGSGPLLRMIQIIKMNLKKTKGKE